MKKKLIQKYQLGKNFNVPDAVTLTLVNYFGKDSPTAKKAILDLATQVAELNGEQLHYISLDNPLYFNSNGKLNVRGSEILKRPRIYTHMGWVDPKDLQLDPNKYYTYNDNVFDPTHYVDYTNSDTYTPISDLFVNYIANTIYDLNVNYGNYKELQRNGSIKPGSKYKFEVNPVLRGYIPGLDSMYDNGNIEGYVSGMQGLTALMNLATGFTPAGYAVISPLIADSGYLRIKNAEDWKDYALGGGEMLLAIAPWLYKGYVGTRSSLNPTYALSRAMNEAPLDAAMLNSYNQFAPLPQYLFSNWETFGGAHPFTYLAGHIHNIDLEDLGRVLSRHGYFDNPKYGSFRLRATLPNGKKVIVSSVETLPTNFPVQISSNPELPIASWGKRGDRTVPDKVISLSDVPENLRTTTNRISIIGNVNPTGDVSVISAYGETPYMPKSISRLLSDLNSENPSPNIAEEINTARKYWDTHAIIDDTATPTRDPFKRGAKKQYIPHTFSSTPVSPSRTTYTNLWSSGKLEMINYLQGPTHKERLITNLGLTEQEADAYIALELRNLENVELVNLGQYKVGRPFGHTIGYAVDKQSGPNLFSKVKDNSDWMPSQWSEQLYENFLSQYEKQARAYDLAKQGVTQVGISEGLFPYKANVGFHEAGHATTRGGMDPALLPIIDYDTKLAAPLLGLNPAMLDPLEARQFGIELDRAWEALLGHLPEYYLRLSPSALRRLFFYDILRASDDAGEKFYLSVPKEWALRFDPKYNYDINRGANGLDPDEALYDFWDKFVYNDYGNDNNIT